MTAQQLLDVVGDMIEEINQGIRDQGTMLDQTVDYVDQELRAIKTQIRAITTQLMNAGIIHQAINASRLTG
jgi:hypothetical protein